MEVFRELERLRKVELPTRPQEFVVNSLIYLVGLVVVVLLIFSFLGLA